MAESFFASLECEPLDRRRFKTKTEARLAVFTWIEGWYNPRRRHSALGQISPMTFEEKRTAITRHRIPSNTGYPPRRPPPAISGPAAPWITLLRSTITPLEFQAPTFPPEGGNSTTYAVVVSGLPNRRLRGAGMIMFA